MVEVSEVFLKIAEKMYKRRDKRNEKKRSEDCDEQEALLIDEENKAEEDLLTSLTELSGAIIKKHGVQWFQLIANKVTLMMKNMFSEKSILTDKISAVCFFDDFIEFASPVSHPLFDMFFGQIIPLCGSDNEALRQACLFGLGVLAQFGKQIFIFICFFYFLFFIFCFFFQFIFICFFYFLYFVLFFSIYFSIYFYFFYFIFFFSI